MSDTQQYIGKLFIVDTPNGVEWTCNEILKEEGLSSDLYESHQEALMDLLNKKYYIKDDVLYKVIISHDNFYDDIAYAKRNPDESIDFILKFYDGGTYFEEMMDEAIDEMEKNNV